MPKKPRSAATMPTKPAKPTRAHESELWAAGHRLVAGVDEVGRGAWAGPLVAAAVVLPDKCTLKGIRDSKLLTKTRRLELSQAIKRLASGIGVGWATATEIDQIGLSNALQLAGWRSLHALGSVDMVILDGAFDYLQPKYQVKTVIRGDNCCLNVAAASIVAKVARDRYMDRMHQIYPNFGFDTNVGYGTRQHQRALVDGITPHHRRSFAPVRLAESGVNH